MTNFQVCFEFDDGQRRDTRIKAASFSDALRIARTRVGTGKIYEIRILDSSAKIAFTCPKCNKSVARKVIWGQASEALLRCHACGQKISLSKVQSIDDTPRKERGLQKQISATHSQAKTKQAFGNPPKSDRNHSRPPSTADRIRATFESPDFIRWRCPNCATVIGCDWKERNIVHKCPSCRCKQYVPSDAFAWNSRLIHERETQAARDKQAREESIAASRKERADRIAREQQAAEAKAAAFAIEIEAMHAEIARVAVGSGLAADHYDFQKMHPDHIDYIAALAVLADELHADLMSAMDNNTKAEKGVAYGRPAAASASLASLLGGYNWVGLAFGALALSARWISDDWKRAKMAEYQAKWGKILSQLSSDEARDFNAVFSFKYPMLAAMASNNLGELPR